MTGISAVILSHNSDKYLDEVLSQVNKIADEIILIDSYSEDMTIETARKHNCKIVQHEFRGYGEERNFGARQASYDWILAVDTDEVMTKNLVKRIRCIKSNGFNNCVYEMKRTNYLFGEPVPRWSNYPRRLYNSKICNYTTPKVHESLRVPDDKSVGRIEAPIKHYTYDTVSEHIDKMNKYTTLEAESNSGSVRELTNSALHTVREHILHRRTPLDGGRGIYITLMSLVYDYVGYYKANISSE